MTRAHSKLAEYHSKFSMADPIPRNFGQLGKLR